MPDLYTPLPGETLMGYLVRSRPEYDWEDASGTAEPWATVPADPLTLAPQHRVRAKLTSAEFALGVALMFPTKPPLGVAPVWPGAEEVTWGDQVALSDGLTIDGPLDGLIVRITSHPDHAGRYDFGERISWTHAGGVVFSTDNGYYEFSQPLGLDLNLLVPRTMEHADHAIVRLGPGFGGTVTPWART